MTRIAVLALVAGCSLETNPHEVEFGGVTYDVVYDGAVHLMHGTEYVRALGEGTLLAYDFSGDGVDDIGVYTDERDGFRHTFAYLEIFVNDGRAVLDATSESAKWKEGHWVWIDPAKFPGLRDATFQRFMREQDEAHD